MNPNHNQSLLIFIAKHMPRLEVQSNCLIEYSFIYMHTAAERAGTETIIEKKKMPGPAHKLITHDAEGLRRSDKPSSAIWDVKKYKETLMGI